MHACAKIGGYIIRSVQDSAEDCVLWRATLYPFVYLSWNAVNTDTNCQLTFSKVHLLLITFKIIFRKYTRESMHLSSIYAWEMYEFAMEAGNQFTVVSLSTLKRECTSRIASSSLIIVRTCSCYRIRHFYIFLYIVSNVLLYSFIATFHICEWLKLENNYYA